ncbi:hypothetical protein NLJ89_g10681 [Agrocybe chaxingu]|uniref:Uncharacterized protein n=1 Tax=Agrocybe chaxingu TaxID=84603 RepID=A0A9W8JQ48_9AGAR|nr:hypothetical protein NLJ89_g10681 [Agrocybe chaxingu]
MYRGSPSPIFDVPEFPALRRVKPLPKRRRTTASMNDEHTLELVAQGATALLQQSAAAAILHQQQQQHGLDGLPPTLTPEDLLTHSDTLSARMALQNYYMPLLGGVQNFLANATNNAPGGEGDPANNTAAAAAAAAFAAMAGAGAGRNGSSPLPVPELDSIEFGLLASRWEALEV